MRSKAFPVLVSALVALTLVSAPIGAAGSSAPGSLDTTFSGDGLRRVSFAPDTYSYVEDLVILGKSGMVVVGNQVASGEVSRFALARLHKGGALDETFGRDGKVTTPFVNAVATLGVSYGDRKIIVAGSDDGQFALARYLHSGELDPTFDGDGKVTTDLTAGEDVIHDIWVKKNGKILVGGTVSSDESDVVMVRYRSDGSLDQTYGDGGKVLVSPFKTPGNSCDPYSGTCRPIATTMFQDDGKLLVVGQYWDRCNGSIALARYNKRGALDETFHHDGRAEVHTPVAIDEQYCDRVYHAFPTSLAIGPKGGVVVGGIQWEEYDCYGCGWHMMVHRYTPEGHLDNTFSSDGVAYVFPGSDWVEVESVVVQPDGKVLAAGFQGCSVGSGEDCGSVVARFKVDGQLDQAFSNDGFADRHFEPGGAQAMGLQGRDKLVVGGGHQGRFAIARYHR